MPVLQYPLSRKWILVQLRCEFRAVPGPGQFPALPVAGIAVWTPPVRAFVRALVALTDPADPLVANGGAPSLAVGTITNAVIDRRVFLGSSTAAVFNSRPLGWNVNTNIAAGSPKPTSPLDEGALLWPANEFFPGETQGARSICPYTDTVGTHTGTLLLVFQWTPFI